MLQNAGVNTPVDGNTDFRVLTAELETVKPVMSSSLGRMEIIIRLPYSFGPDVRAGAGLHPLIIDNLLFIDDETPVEKTRTYFVPEDNCPAIGVTLYQNRLERGKPSIELTLANGEKIVHESSLAVKEMGTLILPLPPGTHRGTPVEVYIKAKSSGLDFRVKNPQTGEIKEVYIESEFTKSQVEFEVSKEKMDAIDVK